MTSHYRHRRSDIATDPLPPQLETGEIAVNTANRQIAVGAPDGAPIALVAVRYFDPRSRYVTNDFVVQGNILYVAKAAIPPGPFVPAQWNSVSRDPSDIQDLSNYLQKSGGTMTGPLVAAADPVLDLEVATKLYVDNSQPPPPNAAAVAVTPTGDVQATNVQVAIAELDAEKVAKAGDAMSGHLTLGGAPLIDLHAATKAYTDTTATAAASTKVSKSGDTMVGALTVNADIFAARTANSGVIFLGTNQAHYLFFDGTNYNMPAGGLVQGGAVSATDVNVGGALNVNQTSNFNITYNHIINTQQNFSAGTPSNLQITGQMGTGNYPTIAFHMPGAFGANFGMHVDGNFYIGGWSFGAGNYYKIHTQRDGQMVTNHRMVYVGDFTHVSFQLEEPFGRNASVTGLQGYNMLSGQMVARYAQHQIMINGGWVAVGGA